MTTQQLTQQLVERNCQRAQLLNPEPDQVAQWEDDGGPAEPERPSRVARAFETIGRAHAGMPYHGGYHYIGRGR